MFWFSVDAQYDNLFCWTKFSKTGCLISETRGPRISSNSDDSNEMMTTDPDDQRIPLVRYLEHPCHIANRKVRWQALKYVMLDNTLYRQTIDGLLLKCFDSDQSRIAIGEVHEGIYGTHQSSHKMKWLFCHAGFYWPTMLNDCFRYYKGCKLCQKFEDMQLASATILHHIIKPWSFCGWAIDFIGQIYPTSSKGPRSCLVEEYDT
jgi:hypothetical protein